MMKLAELSSWKDIKLSIKLGFVVSIIVAGAAIWAGSDPYILTPAEAAEQHKQIARWELTHVQEQIESIELKKVETKYRVDLSAQAKDELRARYDVKLHNLREREKCLKSGKLEC